MTRVALVHDWLTGMRGGERVLEELIRLYPTAEIFTLMHVPGSVSPLIESRPIHTSWLQQVPQARRYYRYLLPFFPRAIEQLDLSGFDLVISVSHAAAKGVVVPPGVPHLCYCLTPMRYVWDLYDVYFGPGRSNALVRLAATWTVGRIRRWDRRVSSRVNRFVAISNTVQDRIARAYDRPASVVYPPVDITRFHAAQAREDFYLVVSALVPYKRIDHAIVACERLGRRLIVVGDGPEMRELRSLTGPNVTFTGRIPDAAVADYYARCRALIIPGEEDFGLTAVEAQASGAPVIAFGKGGVTESVMNGATPRATGVLYHEQTVTSLAEAITRLESMTFDTAALRSSAARFGVERFRREFLAEVDAL